ncbi:MAG TPA: hypothetical protein VL475_11670 [Planctomycetaceae bacterium]|nr:hypothetical protein [Planctomycetaceae bacterium]
MTHSHSTTSKSSPGAALAHDLVDQIEELLLTAQRAGEPIEIDPHRARLFELFVMADATGFLEEGGAIDLSCDGIGRDLSTRWDLAKAMGPGGLAQAASLPPQQLAKVRLLWSFMRMWMEWTYAWKRWGEFHQEARPA